MTRHSFIGVCVCLASGMIAYKSKKQPTVAHSPLWKPSLWVHLILVGWDIGVPQEAASILYEDNNACIAITMS
jgi:hypothetical protein